MLAEFGEILVGGVLLSLLHAVIPNHWMPFAVIARSQGWGAMKTALVTAVGGSAHVASTIAIGVVIGLGSMELEEWTESLHWIAPSALIGIGVILAILHVSGKHLHHHHYHIDPSEGEDCCPGEETYHHGHASEGTVRKAIMRGSILPIVLAMFLSPCAELSVYYADAASHAWVGIGLLSAVYFVITVPGMVAMTLMFRTGLEKLKMDWFEQHELLINGLLFVGLGLLGLFLEMGHEHHH
jgi:hypothetical protein